MRPHGSPEMLERRRQQAILLLQRGLQPVEVARRLGVDRRSVRRWKATYRKRGAKGLQARRVPGRPHRLSPEQKQQLNRMLVVGAEAEGYPTDLWTCPRVAEVIRQHFRVPYHVDHIGRLLHALGWCPQRPERRAIERDERQIQRWVRTQWPQIKKNA